MHFLTALTVASGLVFLTGCGADEGPIDPGAFFVCDARRGQLLPFTDPYPAVAAAP